jgi:acetyltransferase-like isoleucine patch superfamily enzyme
VLRGTRIGPNCVVAAGAVLRDDAFPASSLVGGDPARVLRPLR